MDDEVITKLKDFYREEEESLMNHFLYATDGIIWHGPDWMKGRLVGIGLTVGLAIAVTSKEEA